MRQTIPFTKDITFKTKIGDLTSISLDNDLTLKGEDLIVGNFYLKGTYKLNKDLEEETEYSYKIPCEIAISDDYDTFDSKIDIDDFHYEIINEETLRVNITVLIDNLIKKEVRCIDEVEEMEIEKLEIKEENKEVKKEKRDEINTINIIEDNKNNIVKLDNNTDNNERYLTYSVYIIREEDTIEKIINKYKVTKEDLSNYNDLDNFNTGSKLIIPSIINND